MEADAEKEISKLDQILESVDLLFARVTNIGLTQQKMRTHLELNTQAIDDYECYIRDEDGGAPRMLSEGTALSVFDEMRPSVVVWDGDIGHEVNCHGGLLDLLAHGEEHLVDKKMVSIANPDIHHEPPLVNGIHFPFELGVDAAYDRFEGMSPSHVVLNDEMPHDRDLHIGLLQQVVWSSECKGDEVVKWDDELQHDLESYCLL